MKHISFTFLLVMLMSMTSNKALAYDIAVENADGVTIYYNYINNGKELEVTRDYYSSYSKNITIPDEVSYMGRTRKVTSIGAKAFYGGTNLTAVTIPNSVTTIGDSAFYKCSRLPTVTIPNSVTTIGSSAFHGCRSLTTATIPNSVTTIGNSTFYQCKSLTTITIPNSVTTIGDEAFSECSSLTTITIPNSITSIGNDAFSWCSALASITIPNSVTSIGNYAFSWCSALASITIPNSITSIGNGVFNDCYKLTAITIPSSVTSIGSSAFNGCIKLTVVTIPNSVTSIGNSAFCGCSSLTTITIPNSITTIGNSAFNFSNNKGDIVKITSLIEEPKNISQDAFSDDLYKNASLYIPKGTMEKYKACTGWKNFIWMEEGTGSGTGEGTTPTTDTCATPTISYSKGKLTFSCETEGATCHSSITDADIASYSTNEVELGVTYNISVYAAKAGWYNSETVTATLCWIDQEPKTEGMETGMAQVAAKAVLIQSEGGTIHVQGAEDGTPVSVYDLNGSQAGSAISQYGTASINTSLQSGSIAIVKVGQKSIKVLVR